MQPPRRRVRQLNLSTTPALRSIILNSTAAVTTVLLLRLATLLLTDADVAAVPYYIQLLTEPVVWPFKLLPVLGSSLVQDATVADLAIVPIAAMAGLVAAGVLAGWRESTSASRPYANRQE